MSDPLIEEARKLLPEFQDLSDREIAESVYDMAGLKDEELPREQYLAELGLTSLGEEFNEAVPRGLKMSAGLLTKGLPSLVSRKLGFEEYSDQLADEFSQYAQKVYADHPTAVKGVEEVESLSDAGRLIASFTGEGIGDLGLALASGGVGAIAGAGGRVALKQAFKDNLSKYAKEMGKESVENSVLYKAFGKGTEAGILTSSFGTNIGESYINLVQEGEADETDVALVSGMLKGSLDFLVPAQILKKTFGGLGDAVMGKVAEKGIKKSLGKDIVFTAGLEGLTESAQEAIDIAAVDFVKQHNNFFTQENLNRIVNAGLAGALGGGAVGAVSSGIQAITNLGETKNAIKNIEQLQIKQGENAEVNLDKYEEEIDLINPGEVSNTGLKTRLQTTQEQETQDTNPVANTAAPITEQSLEELKKQQKLSSLKSTQEIKETVSRLNPTDPSQESDILPARPKLPINISNNPNATITSLGNKFLKDVVRNQNVAKTPSTSTEGPAVQLVTDTEGNILEARVPQSINLEAVDDTQKTPVEIVVPEVNMEATNFRPSTLQTPDKKVKTEYNEKDDVRYQRLPGFTEASNFAPTEPAPLASAPQGQPYLRDGNLRFLPLSKKSAERLKPYTKQIEKKIREIAPQVEPKFVDVLDAVEGDQLAQPIRGAQLGNTIYVAVGFNDANQYDSYETSLHETFHFLYNLPNYFSASEKQTLRSNYDKIAEYVQDKTGLHPTDLSMLDGEQAREELFATAFGLYASEVYPRGSNKPSVRSLGSVNSVFKKIINLMKRIASRFKGQSFEDIFDTVLEGNRPTEAITDALNAQRIARLQRSVASMQVNRQKSLGEGLSVLRDTKDFKKLLSKSARKSVQNEQGTNSLKVVNNVTRWFGSIPGIAASNPFVANVFDVLRRQEKDRSAMDVAMNEQVQLLTQDRELYLNGMAVLDFLDKDQQELQEDSNGQIIYIRDGKRRKLNPELSQQVKNTKKFFDQVIATYEDVMLQNVRAMGYTDILQASDVNKHIAYLEQQAEESETGEFGLEINRLEKIRDNLTQIEELKNSNVPYFPHMRFGDHGVVVKDKETGEQVALYTLNENMMTNGLNKEEMADIQNQIKEKGYDDKTKFTVSDPFRLTYNDIQQQLKLGDADFNMELLSSLIHSVDGDKYDEIATKLEGDKRLRGFGRFLKRRQNIEGYSRDYDRVLPAYASAFSRFYVNQKYALENAGVRAEIEKYKGDPKVKEWLKEYHEYVNSPKGDSEFLRTFNFMYALGANPSTAMLQLMTVFTASPAVIAQFKGNVLTANASIAGSMKQAIDLATMGLDKLKDLDTVKKVLKDPDEAEAVHSAVVEGVLRPAQVEDYLNGSQFAKGSTQGKLLQVSQNVGKVLGAPISAMEEISRITSFLSFYRALKTPEAQSKARKVYEKDERFKTALEYNPDQDFRTFMTEFLIDETHAVFGKVGRNSNQRGVWGSLVFPFMTHPMQTMELFYRMAFKRGGAGRTAFLSMLGLFLAFAGLQGLPGEELLKETAELGHKLATGRDINLDFEMRKAFVSQFGFSPKMANFIQKGAFGATGADLSRRVQVPLFVQPLATSLLSGQDDVYGFLGTQGSAFTQAIKNAQAFGRGDASLADFAVQSFTPIAIQNMYEAAVILPNKGYRTKSSGDPLVAPENITAKDIGMEALGFRPNKLSEAYLFKNAERLGKYGHIQGMNKYKRRIVNLQEEKIKAMDRNENEKVKLLEEEIAEVTKEAYAFSEKAGRPMDITKIRAFNQSISNQLIKRKQPTFDPRPPKHFRPEDITKYLLLEED